VISRDGNAANSHAKEAWAATAGGRAMQAHVDSNRRLKELIAKIEIEQNPRTFSALVEELNRLLDSDQSAKKPPTA
jgi:hypothetical protein